jgi:outer membrane lipoprotein-sorting protein
MMKQILLRVVLLWLVCLSISAAADRFDTIKGQLAQAACTRFEFVSIIESEIFEATDSASGTAYIARDGRFNVTLGEDRYLFDLCFLYSYSAENNQVVIEKVSHQTQISREISFITRLDELYETHTIRPGKSYRLLKKPDEKSDIPDSVTVFIAQDTSKLERLEYFDINEERNVIVIKKQETRKDCDNKQFEPTFPDSVERVRL